MIPLTHAAGSRVALFGLGGSGLATAQALIAGGAQVTAWDDNPASVAKAAQAGVETGDLRTLDWSALDALVLSPGVPLTHPRPHWSVELARNAGVEVIGDVELFFRERRHACPQAEIVAITGTNGKSTTTALITHVLRTMEADVQMGGNIGRAVLTLEPFAPGRIYVVEVSSYQIDLAPTLDPDMGVLLNLSPDHLDRHGTFENYARVKERLVIQSKQAVVGLEDEACRAIAGAYRHAHGVAVHHETMDGIWYEDGDIISRERGAVYARTPMSEYPALMGRHNAQNLLVTTAVVQLLDPYDRRNWRGFNEGLRTFPGLAHRLERVGRVGDVMFVNDSKATNPDAAATALSSFERVHWIAGGLPKDGGIEALRPLFGRVAKAYLVGEAAPAFAAVLGAATIPYEISGTVEQAVNHALADAQGSFLHSGDVVVLLSPACASFDQFRNFEERGEAFRRAVESLEGFEPL